MRRAWAMLLCLVASGASAFVGSFPVCEPRAQYVRLEIYEGFAPADCVRVTLAEGDVRFLLATLAGFPITACVDLRGDVARMYLRPDVTDDSVLGHELRHAFAPQESHPLLLPMVSLPCE